VQFQRRRLLLTYFSDGLALAMDKKRCGFIDKTGKFAIKPQWFACWDRNQEVFLASQGERLLSLAGKTTVYESPLAVSFSEGLAAVRNAKLWGYVNKTGKMVIPFRFDQARSFSEQLAVVGMVPAWIKGRRHSGHF
jgi:hypothetical protein